MITRYDILPDEQRALLPALEPTRRLGFVLYGGTAIAFRLGHRQSVDFDFFSSHQLDEARLIDAIPLLGTAFTLQRAVETWTVLVVPPEGDDRPVKLSFFGGLGMGRVEDPAPTTNGELLLASLPDLFGHKLKVLLQRVEAKDYEDIAALLRSGLKIEHGLGVASALFGPTFPAADALRALTYFEGGDVECLSQATRAILTDAAARAGRVPPIAILSRDLVAPGHEG